MCVVNYTVNSVNAVANFVLSVGRKRGIAITNMKLQKLVYFAQGWALARLEHPLFEEEIQAWTYGPVIPALYEAAKNYQNDPITGVLSARDEIAPQSESARVLLEMMDTFGELRPMELVSLSHEPKSPWAAAWVRGKYSRIPLWQMALYFRNILVPSAA